MIAIGMEAPGDRGICLLRTRVISRYFLQGLGTSVELLLMGEEIRDVKL
jgi:hypothetical protein